MEENGGTVNHIIRSVSKTPTIMQKSGSIDAGNGDVNNTIGGVTVNRVGNGGGGGGGGGFDRLDLNARIVLNGSNGGVSDTSNVRIDEQNSTSSLHLNNPFVINYMAQQHLGRADAYHQINYTKNNGTMKNSESSGELNLYHGGIAATGVASGIGGPSDSSIIVHPRPQRPHSIAVSNSMMAVTAISDRKQPLTLTTASKTSMAHSASSGVLHKQSLAGESAHGFKPVASYGQYVSNSPSRMMTTSRSSQEFTLYSMPNVVPVMHANGAPTVIPPPVVQRRSQSTPRPVHGTIVVTTGSNLSVIGTTTSEIPQRPRSLDRSLLGVSMGQNLMEKKSKPPPIPSRRFSQPLAGQPQMNQGSPSAQRIPVANGMRQSATFHGQINRMAAGGFAYPSKDGSDVGTRRKQDRPLSYAYGTLSDQVYLENQLKIYSEQLRTITETVRKYSEQAKLLSEMKRQQQQMYQSKRSFDTLPRRASLELTDSNADCVIGTEPRPSAHHLKLYLDTMRTNGTDSPAIAATSSASATQRLDAERSRTLPRRGAESPGRGGSKSIEAKTPSDQLRQILDAIRSNQLPEEEENLSEAATRFSKFKENLEKSRPKSMTDFEPSAAISETFNQVSDNLRIMNEDLEALARSPARKALNDRKPPPTDSQPNNMFDFNQILDRFTQLTNNSHSMETVDYLRKCSEALRQTSDQLRMAGMHNNYSDSNDSSSCSTTPGSIREAVQNLLQQPRNGMQIMDDRMKLFIDILDSQSKFSQVNK